MIRALQTGPDGPIVVLGLTSRNLDGLADNRPIRANSAQVGLRPSFEIWVLGGRVLSDLHADLRGIGVDVPPEGPAVDRGLLHVFTHWVGRGARTGRYPLTQPVLVLGVTADADARLRAGHDYLVVVSGQANAAVRLLGGGDSDALMARVASGRHPCVEVRAERTG